jgi:hypothetical protein
MFPSALDDHLVGEVAGVLEDMPPEPQPGRQWPTASIKAARGKG